MCFLELVYRKGSKNNRDFKINCLAIKYQHKLITNSSAKEAFQM